MPINFKFKDWFFRQYPDWHQNNDVNKNNLGEGTFQRYLRIFGEELDEEIIPYLDNFLDLIDVQKTDDKYLPLVANILGNPPSFGNDNSVYRKILAYIIAIYKVKGTKTAYKIFFNLLGLKVTVVEDLPKKKITYDQVQITYDAGYKYDSFCEYCSEYKLAVSDINNTSIPWSYTAVPQETKDKLQSIICFLQPINAKFGGFATEVNMAESITPDITETTNIP